MNRPSTAKRIRQIATRTKRNRAARTALKTTLKTITAAMAAKDIATATRLLRPAIATLDKAASKHVIRKERASRTAGRLSRRLHKLTTATPASS